MAANLYCGIGLDVENETITICAFDHDRLACAGKARERLPDDPILVLWIGGSHESARQTVSSFFKAHGVPGELHMPLWKQIAMEIFLTLQDAHEQN